MTRCPDTNTGTQANFYAKLDELKELKAGWDSYNGLPIKQEAIDLAAQVYGRLRPLLGIHAQPVPGSGGEVQVEWHELDYTVEIFIVAKDRA